MTDRKFTPPTEFPAEYVTSGGQKVEVLGQSPSKEYPLVGWIARKGGGISANKWTSDGSYFSYSEPSEDDLHDPPKKQVHWANDYEDALGPCWYDSRLLVNRCPEPNRIAVIRREWIEGQPPQYFTEEV